MSVELTFNMSYGFKFITMHESNQFTDEMTIKPVKQK